MSNWITHERPWPQDGTTLKASGAVTAAGTTTPVKVGKGLLYIDFNVSAVNNGTGDKLRAEVQFNRYATKDNNVSARIVWDADFVTSNTIDIDVGAQSMTQVTFATSHAVTVAAVVTNLNLLTGITATLNVEDTNSRTIDIVVDDLTTAIGTVTETVAAGASQATGTITYDGDWYTAGVMVFDDAIEGGVMDAIGRYPLIVLNPYDYQCRIKHTINSSPSVTYAATAHPLTSKKTI